MPKPQPVSGLFSGKIRLALRLQGRIYLKTALERQLQPELHNARIVRIDGMHEGISGNAARIACIPGEAG